MSETAFTIEQVIAQFVRPEFKEAAALVAKVAVLEERSRHADLIRTTTAFVEELRSMGYGETSERALPGSFDAMVLALEKVK